MAVVFVKYGEREACKGDPGDGLARSPVWRGIIKAWKSQYDTTINCVWYGMRIL